MKDKIHFFLPCKKKTQFALFWGMSHNNISDGCWLSDFVVKNMTLVNKNNGNMSKFKQSKHRFNKKS